MAVAPEPSPERRVLCVSEMPAGPMTGGIGTGAALTRTRTGGRCRLLRIAARNMRGI